jgi:hypothetical protein
MNQQQIQLVQGSFAQVKPIADIAADLFYDRLFMLDPWLTAVIPVRPQRTKA